jgi:diguanylate cyclase (GGDEF)-like protein
MNIFQFFPVIAAIVDVGLALVVLINRPRLLQQKVFMSFLLAAACWSFSDFLLRSSFFPEHKLTILRLVIITSVLWAVQFYYFCRLFMNRSKDVGVYIGYSLLGANVILCAAGIVPTGVTVNNWEVHPVYGWWTVLWVAPMAILAVMIIVELVKRLRTQITAEERNKLNYLICAVALIAGLGIPSVASIIKDLSLGSVGGIFCAAVLTFAVIKHDLISISVFLRRILGWATVYAICVIIFEAVQVICGIIFRISFSPITIVSSFMGTLAVTSVILWLRPFFLEKIDQLFYRERYKHRLELQNFVFHTMRGISNLKELGEGVLPPLTRALDCHAAYILLPDKTGQNFGVHFSEGATTKTSGTLQIKTESPLVVALNEQYLTRKDVEIRPDLRGMWTSERDAISHFNIELLFPLINRGIIIGILALGRSRSGKYSLDDIKLVESITNTIAISLEKERYHTELAMREKELRIINRLTGIINSSLNVQDVYETFIQGLRENVEVDFAAIGVIENTNLEILALYNKNNYPLHLGEKLHLQSSGMEWAVISKKTAIYSNSKPAKDGFFIKQLSEHNLCSTIFEPLVNKGDVIGILMLGKSEGNPFTEEQVLFIEQVASQVSTAVVNARLYASAEARSRVDELTGLYNRRHFDEAIEKEIRRDFRYGNSFSLLMMDLDRFKSFNDSNGHVTGDKLLTQVANIIRNSSREVDLSFRYGGDEFAVILPNTAIDHGVVVAERIRQNVEKEMESRNSQVTVSIGVASWPGDGLIPPDLINAADRALYYAKKTGTNRVCIAAQTVPSIESTKEVTDANEKQIMDTIYALAATIEARDRYTYGHSRKVCTLAVELAESIKMSPEKVALVSHAALLHDIGKIGVYDTILNKPGALTTDERELIKMHPKLSRDIVAHVPNLTPCLPAILHHHERWDGKGYPFGLKGENIPLEARILSIADSFDAMTSARPYRQPLPAETVINELKKCSGSQFDPELVEAFLPIAMKAMNVNPVHP